MHTSWLYKLTSDRRRVAVIMGGILNAVESACGADRGIWPAECKVKYSLPFLFELDVGQRRAFNRKPPFCR